MGALKALRRIPVVSVDPILTAILAVYGGPTRLRQRHEWGDSQISSRRSIVECRKSNQRLHFIRQDESR